MKSGFKRYKYHPWFRGFRRICGRFIVPFIIFQGIRTILLPTLFDVFLLTILLTIALSIYLDIF